ncbi:MAG: N-acetylmuramoyl-L-alanine amidase [Phycisphaerae bacterium]|nr:N-acetylmuramoyl-L-alanine amidase [Phycisphaerae bacterium]
MLPPFSRREVLQTGLLASAAALLAGCQGSGPVADLSRVDVAWPDKDAVKPAPLPPSTPPPTRAPTGVSVGPPPGVVPRSAWTRATVIESRTTRMPTVSRITVHHEGNAFSGSDEYSAIARRLANIREGHIRRRPEPFADIGYHFIIDPSGRIWEGRPIRYQGAHVEAQNEQNLGIMLIGNFDVQRPTQAQLISLESFLVDRMRFYRVPVSRVYTHRELKSTACPGRNLQSWMIAARSPAGTFARA